MGTVLVSTDFSAASRHALDYACGLFADKDLRLELLHVFPIPIAYTAEGVALAAVSTAIERAEEQMAEDVARVRAEWPHLSIQGRVETGGFLETLRAETARLQPRCLVLGTAGFADLYPGDTDPLDALRRMKVPVLFVPQGAALKPIRKTAWAVNYAYAGPEIPVGSILQWLELIGSELELVHTDAQPPGGDPKQAAGESWLRGQLSGLVPQFRWVQDSDVLRGLSAFLSGSDADCVLVVPRRYGIWQNLFRRSRTKALARLNRLPIVAFPRRQA